MLTSLRRKARADEGFSLIELVVAVAILGLVMGAICAAMVAALRSNKESDERLTESRDIQFASTWFGDDVQSASKVIVGAPAPGGALCTTPAGSTVWVQFENYDIATPAPTAPPTAAPYGVTNPRKITYALSATGELYRIACGGAPASTDVVAHSLLAGTPDVSATASTVAITLTEKASNQKFVLQGSRRSE